MMMFWILGAAMIAAALAVLLLPLLRPGAGGGAPDVSELNLRLHRERLAELEAEYAEGRIGEEEFTSSRDELERSLLEDVVAPAAAAAPAAPAARPLYVVLALLVPVLALGLYARLGSIDQIGQGAAAPMAESTDPAHNDAAINEMVTRLEQRMQATPEDGEGWAMLGRSYLFMGQPDRAVSAFARAEALLGEDARLLADYAEAQALVQGNSALGRPAELAERALAVDADSAKALWVAGIAAFQRADYAQALNHWGRLERQLPPGSESAVTLAQLSAQARDALGTLAPADDAVTPAAAPAEAPAAAGRAVQVQVELDPALAARAAPADVVLIYARAVDGPRMPLAVVRKQVADLPLEVTLDDSMSMAAGLTLSSFPQVEVLARVSKSGGAAPQSGDLQGQSPALGMDMSSTRVIIDGVLP